MNSFWRTTTFVHYLLEQFLKEGELVVDATAGNGWDTLFLAKNVGPQGLVYAFDLQEKALQATQKLLVANNCLTQVQLILAGHEKMQDFVAEAVSVIIYNLGYLPGGSKKIITRGETTLLSLKQGLSLLKPGGVIALVVYPGHPGGSEEAACLYKYVASLSKLNWQVFKWGKLNGDPAQVPTAIFIYKNIK